MIIAPFRYATSRVVVHWLAAVAVFFLLLTGTFVLESLPNNAQKIGNLRIHMTIGAIVGVLVIARILLRRRHPLAPEVSGGRIVRLGHLLLDLLVLLMALSGLALALQSGLLGAVLDGGTLPDDFKVFLARKVHGLAAKLTMGAVALHVLAALYHHFIVKDGLLARMRLRAGNR